MCKFKQEFITVFLKKKKVKERVTLMRSNFLHSVWINAEVFTYSEELNFLVRKNINQKRNLDFPNSKCKIERETNSETCFHLFCQMHSEEFPFHLWIDEKLNW